MAERPVFLPATTGTLLVEEVPIRFQWHPGLAPAQKKKNVTELHQAALAHGLGPLLEISSKSELEVGQKLSAFHLKIKVGDKQATVECVYQGSKVLRRAEWAGFTDIEFNPERSLNCQARSFAAFISLQRRDQLDAAVSSFHNFKSVMQSAAI